MVMCVEVERENDQGSGAEEADRPAAGERVQL